MESEQKDVFGNNLSIGDTVGYAPNGAYAGISLGLIVKFTDKCVGIQNIKNGVGRHLSPSKNKLYYAAPHQVLLAKREEK